MEAARGEEPIQNPIVCMIQHFMEIVLNGEEEITSKERMTMTMMMLNMMAVPFNTTCIIPLCIVFPWVVPPSSHLSGDATEIISIMDSTNIIFTILTHCNFDMVVAMVSTMYVFTYIFQAFFHPLLLWSSSPIPPKTTNHKYSKMRQNTMLLTQYSVGVTVTSSHDSISQSAAQSSIVCR